MDEETRAGIRTILARTGSEYPDMVALKDALWALSDDQLRTRLVLDSVGCAWCDDDEPTRPWLVDGVSVALCETCADMAEVVADGPLTIESIVVDDPRPDIWPMREPGGRVLTFVPPLVLRLTMWLGKDGPFIIGCEDPHDPHPLGVSDVNGEPHVSGGDAADLVACLSAQWGFHYMVNASEVERGTDADGDPLETGVVDTDAGSIPPRAQRAYYLERIHEAPRVPTSRSSYHQ